MKPKQISVNIRYPKKNENNRFFGGKYELKLMNELTQKAIARECADWIRRKAKFKSINIETDEMPMVFELKIRMM